MKIKSITIEGFRGIKDKRCYDFSDINYLVGKNGSGKSTVLYAIQLALLGYIPGTNKRKSDIFRHSSSHTMAVTLNIEDDGKDVMIRRVWVGSTSGISCHTDIIPSDYDVESRIKDLEVPVFNFNDFTNMTANQLKDWFLNFLPSSSEEVDWRSEMKSSVPGYSDVFDSILESSVKEITSCGESGLNQIRWANNYFKQYQSFKKSELDRLVGTIQSLIHYDDIDEVSSQDVSIKISELSTKKFDHEQAMMIKMSNDRLNNILNSEYSDCSYGSVFDDPRYISLKEKYDDLCSNIDSSSIKLSEVEKNLSDISSKLSNIRSKMYSLDSVIDKSGICPYTEDKCDKIMNLVNEYKKQRQHLQEELDSSIVSENLLKDEKIKIQKRSTDDQNNRFKLVTEINNIKSRYEKSQMMRSQIKDVPDCVNDNTDYELEINKLQDLKGKILANEKYNSLIDSLTKQKMNLDLELSAIKNWVSLTGVNGLQLRSSSENPFDILKSRVDSVLSVIYPSMSCSFNIENKSNSFNMGVISNGNYIPYDLLSSGEKCIYSLCMMISLINISDSELNLVIVDDSFDHLDDDNLKSVFNALVNVKDVQMIFAGVNYFEGLSNIINLIEVK